jgi:hypothetical protein
MRLHTERLGRAVYSTGGLSLISSINNLSVVPAGR